MKVTNERTPIWLATPTAGCSATSTTTFGSLHQLVSGLSTLKTRMSSRTLVCSETYLAHRSGSSTARKARRMIGSVLMRAAVGSVLLVWRCGARGASAIKRVRRWWNGTYQSTGDADYVLLVRQRGPIGA